MNTFLIRVYLLFMTSFFIAYSNSTAPLHTTTTQSNHLSANPANDVQQTYGTMARLKYSDSPKEGMVNTIASPLDLNHVMVSTSFTSIGSGSVLDFKVDSSGKRLTEIKVISATHVYQPLSTGGLSDEEYINNFAIMEQNLNSIISLKWLDKGIDPAGVITPAHIKHLPTPLEKNRGFIIQPKLTEFKSASQLSPNGRDIVVATYSSADGLNSEELSEKWKSFVRYNYTIPPIGEVDILCVDNCEFKLGGFGKLGNYISENGYFSIRQRTRLLLNARAYRYEENFLNNEWIFVNVMDLVAKYFDPYTTALLETTKYFDFQGYSGSTVLIKDKTLGIVSRGNSREVGTDKFLPLTILLVPFVTKDPVYHKWLMDHVHR